MQQGDDIDEFLDELNDDDDGVNINDGDSIDVNVQRDHLREHMKTICERELCIYKNMSLLAGNNLAKTDWIAHLLISGY